MSTKTTLAEKTCPEGESAKQFLRILQREGHFNDLQLKAVSARHDELVAGGAKDPLRQALRDFDSGKIKVSDRAANAMRPPTVFDAPEGESLKQTLSWLRREGSLSDTEVRAAAAALNARTDLEALTEDDLAEILAQVGAVRALPEGFGDDAVREGAGEGAEVIPITGNSPTAQVDPAPELKDEQLETLDEPPEGEREGDDEEDLSPEDLYAMNAEAVGKLVAAQADDDVLAALHAWEREHPKYEGGRTTVLNAIEERRGELATPNSNDG
jgi:hypothetical protein